MRKFRAGLKDGLCAGLGQVWLSIKVEGFSFVFPHHSLFPPPLTITAFLTMSSYQEVPIASIGPLASSDCKSPPMSSVVGGLSCL